MRYLYIIRPQQLLTPGQLPYFRYQINHALTEATEQGLIVRWD